MDTPIKRIYVDASCIPNPGITEYRGVDDGGNVLFSEKIGYATNNIGEFLAIVHAITFHPRFIYSDSFVALSWVRKKRCGTECTGISDDTARKIKDAILQLKKNECRSIIIQWNTRKHGQIPADYGHHGSSQPSFPIWKKRKRHKKPHRRHRHHHNNKRLPQFEGKPTVTWFGHTAN